MKLTASDFHKMDCSGTLLKLDGRSKSWKKRFCILSDAFLYLYTDKDASSALGEIRHFLKPIMMS